MILEYLSKIIQSLSCNFYNKRNGFHYFYRHQTLYNMFTHIKPILELKFEITLIIVLNIITRFSTIGFSTSIVYMIVFKGILTDVRGLAFHERNN